MILIILLILGLISEMLYVVVLRFNPGLRQKGLTFAKFTPGLMLSEMRGKVAASVYTKNKAGAAIRNRTTPINRRSTSQTQKRQQLSSLSSSWRGLTASQIAGWNAAAASFPQQDSLGQTIFLTGAQLYIRCNANLLLTGGALITDAPAPTSFDVLALGASAFDASAGTMTQAFTPTPVPAGFNLVIRATRPLSAGKSFVGSSEFRFIQSVAAAGASPANIAAAYIAKFGAITGATGQKVFVEAFLMETLTGLAGIPVRTSALIVA